MGRRKAHTPLNVFLNRRLAGRLSKEAGGAIAFQYDRSWLEWQHSFAISLSLLTREAAYTGAPVAAVFDNLLPDNDSVRRKSPNAPAPKEWTPKSCWNGSVAIA